MFRDVIESITKVINEGAYLNLVISNVQNKRNNEFTPHEKKLYTKLTYGVCENKLLIDFLLSPLISGKRIKPFAKNTLRLGVYAISFMNIPNHYVVNELVKEVKKEDYKGSTFINAILRKYISENMYESGLERLSKKPYMERLSITYSINIDLLSLLMKQYSNIEEILKSSEEKINCYRINTLKTTIKDVEELLKKLDIKYQINGVTLKTKETLVNTDAFLNGLIISQDASSIRVGEIANPEPNMHVLDVCSAPGSKSAHMAAIMNNTGSILSCDIYEHKLILINENMLKLGVKNVQTILADGTKTNYPEMYDLVLVDAPCSGLGVINHKCDLKYNMTIAKINEINALQKQILEHVSLYVKKNSYLVYSTCTINKLENELLINEFLINHPCFKKIEEEIIVQNVNGSDDGFYIAKLRKD